ncbi:Nuclear transcription factor Y subunit C-4 [Capsicum baccatum]|uniref:Nuclear transcription factor Y subunit C-4 n=1 Tax=Capsicum baccatum TaxID=33114 RepID=A0A2G2WM63_CAPBA|nr:Nuclear transcription factor Y subunit C-4 [Capsicum baccatum]
MKADEDVRMILAETPVLFAKACEMFIQELTLRSWIHSEENKRRTLQKNDIAAAISRTDTFDFLVDIIPRDEVKDEGVGLGLAPGGVPYYYPPLGQPAPGGVMLGRPAVPAGVVPGAVPGVVPGTVLGTLRALFLVLFPVLIHQCMCLICRSRCGNQCGRHQRIIRILVEVEVAVDRVPMTAKSEVKLEVMEGNVISLSIVNSRVATVAWLIVFSGMATMKYDILLLDHNIKFSLWQVKMRDVLAQMDLEEALLGFDKMPSSWTDEDKWRKDQKALSQIHLHLSNQIL